MALLDCLFDGMMGIVRFFLPDAWYLFSSDEDDSK